MNAANMLIDKKFFKKFDATATNGVEFSLEAEKYTDWIKFDRGLLDGPSYNEFVVATFTPITSGTVDIHVLNEIKQNLNGNENFYNFSFKEVFSLYHNGERLFRVGADGNFYNGSVVESEMVVKYSQPVTAFETYTLKFWPQVSSNTPSGYEQYVRTKLQIKSYIIDKPNMYISFSNEV